MTFFEESAGCQTNVRCRQRIGSDGPNDKRKSHGKLKGQFAKQNEQGM
jgi:hypothetical protein